MPNGDSNCAVEYREIHGFPGYEIGSDGSARSYRNTGGPFRVSPRILKPRWRKGYLQYQMTDSSGRRRYVFAHGLLLKIFKGEPKPAGAEGRHLDDNQSNNRLENLAWGTRLDNASDREKNNKTVRGERSGTAKLTEASVREILSLLEVVSQEKIGIRFGVTQAAIYAIAKGLTWRHISGRYSPRRAELKSLATK